MLRKLAGFSAMILVAMAFIAAGTIAVEAQSVRVKGEVAGVNQSNQSILITTEKGFVTVRVDGMTQMTRNKQSTFLHELQIGEQLDVNYDAVSMTAQAISIRKPYVKGFITGFPTIRGSIPVLNVTITPFKGTPVTVQVSPKAKIVKNSEPAQFEDLEVGDYAKAYYETKTMIASTIEAYSTVSVKSLGVLSYRGVIAGIRLQPPTGPGQVMKIVLKPLVGKIMSFYVRSTTVVTLNGKAATMNDIKMGDLADVRVLAGSADALQVKLTRNTPDPGAIEGEFLSEN